MPRSVSCTIMAYNEEATLADAVRDVVDALRALERPFEVIIVDDGSTDATSEIARRMVETYPGLVRVLTHPENRGPGSALATGFAASRNDVVCFHPADQQLPFGEVAALIPLLDHYEMIVGHRSGRPGYTALRRLSSRVYIRLVQLLFGLRQFGDFNFIYLYRKDLLDRIPIETRGVFMPTELLVKAVDAGARITVAQVTCLPRRHGVATCGRPRVIGRTVRELGRFWIRRRLGRHQPARPA